MHRTAGPNLVSPKNTDFLEYHCPSRATSFAVWPLRLNKIQPWGLVWLCVFIHFAARVSGWGWRKNDVKATISSPGGHEGVGWRYRLFELALRAPSLPSSR